MQLPAVAPYSIPDSAVEFEAQLDPFDPGLAYFDCGTDATALGNAPARRLYSRNGFFEDPRGIFQNKRGIDMLEIRKTLAP